jgi:K+-transporting ATPase KdpF subunit
MQFFSPWELASSLSLRFMPRSANAREESPMTFDHGLGALVTLGIFVYLLYALIRPERF